MIHGMNMKLAFKSSKTINIVNIINTALIYLFKIILSKMKFIITQQETSKVSPTRMQ